MGIDSIQHGPWTITYAPAPIPARNCDWQFSHRDFDASWEGEDDGWVVTNGLSGCGSSVEDCKAQIRDIEEDKNMPLTASTAP
jgi:hypothetical protein